MSFSNWVVLASITTFLAGPLAHAEVDSLAMANNIATAENLENFELLAPPLTEQQEKDLAFNEQLEEDQEYQAGAFDEALNSTDLFQVSGRSSNIVVEIFQGSSIGKQFLTVRQNGSLRFVFAISAAKAGKSTPAGTFGVEGQLWRHMSTLYPSRGENNMDHVTYFAPYVGFHSATFGAYSILGRRASHGCVRLGRPEVRTLYTLIKQNGQSATVISRKSGDPTSDVGLIRSQLAKDLNFIQSMISAGNKGDVPLYRK